jgi:hypothetical protein
VVNKIDWDKAGRVTEPGRYMLAFGWLNVTAADVAVWQQYPGARFTLVQVPTRIAPDTADAAPDSDEYRLGTFDLAGA